MYVHMYVRYAHLIILKILVMRCEYNFKNSKNTCAWYDLCCNIRVYTNIFY